MSTATETETNTSTDLDFPSMWGVKLLNDDYTPMDFVIMVLMHHFGQTVEEAEAITIRVHHHGEAVVGHYTKDIAVTKATIAEHQARQLGHPLRLDPVPV